MTRRTVLIVEDEKISSLFLENVLTESGYRVTATASTGEEAVRAAAAEPPDVVIMDVGLRGEMDGAEAAGIISRHHGTPVLFVTAYTRSELERNNDLPATFDLLAKPIVEQELIQKLKLLFGDAR